MNSRRTGPRVGEHDVGTSNETLHHFNGGWRPAWLGGDIASTQHYTPSMAAPQASTPMPTSTATVSSSFGTTTAVHNGTFNLSTNRATEASMTSPNFAVTRGRPATSENITSEHEWNKTALASAAPVTYEQSVGDLSTQLQPNAPALVASAVDTNVHHLSAENVTPHSHGTIYQMDNQLVAERRSHTAAEAQDQHGKGYRAGPYYLQNLSTVHADADLQQPIHANPGAMIADTPPNWLAQDHHGQAISPRHVDFIRTEQYAAPSMPGRDMHSTVLPQNNPSRVFHVQEATSQVTMHEDILAILRYFVQPHPSNSPYINGAQMSSKLEDLYVSIQHEPRQASLISRFQALQNAAFRGDTTFVLLQQLMCALAYTGTVWPASLNEPKALSFMINIWGHEAMSAKVYKTFVEFPVSLYSLTVQHASTYNYMMHHVTIMYRMIARSWERLSSLCLQRRYPPTVKEFLMELGIPSVQLMACCVAYIMRRLWPGDVRLEEQINPKALAIFMANLHAIYQCHTDIVSLMKANEDPFRSRYAALDAELRATRPQVSAPVYTHNPSSRDVASSLPIIYQISAQLDSRGYGSPRTDLGPRAAVIDLSRQPARSSMIKTPTTIPAPHASPGDATASWPSQLPAVKSTTANPLFYPASGMTIPQLRVPAPATTAMHQLHLQDPPRRLLEDGKAIKTSYFQYVQDHRRVWCDISHQFPITRCEFEVDEAELSNLPSTSEMLTQHGVQITTRDLTPTTVEYRLRCFHESKPSKVDFPFWLSLRLNDEGLEVRRKAHFGQDLAIDITNMLKAGTNKLLASITLRAGDKKAIGWTVSVETIVLKNESDIQVMATANAIDEKTSLDSTIARLGAGDTETAETAPDDGDDDDIVMVSQNLRISPTDPITRRLVGDLPVRTRSCRHAECFSLATFLESRPRIPHRFPTTSNADGTNSLWDVGEATLSAYDRWECPVAGCREDASPPRLCVDLWMREVQARLALRTDGQGNECTIVVERDGSWRIEEPRRKGGAGGPL